ncbi:hypothetical protein Tco_1351760 [Tanacetum coccineum]
MGNANPFIPAPPVLPMALHAKVVQELNELQAISAYINSRLENIDQFLNGFTQPPNKIHMDDLESNDESLDTPLVSPFLDSDDDSNDSDVLNEREEYGNTGKLCGKKDYNTIMVDGLESAGVNLVAIVRDVYVFVGSFTYVTDFMVLEDIGEFILRDMTEVVMGKPFREVTKLKYDCAKGLMSFTRIFVNYTFQMPRTIPRLKIWGHVSWSKIPPILVLSQRDLINRFRSAYEKNKLMYKNCLNLGPDYQVDDSMNLVAIVRDVYVFVGSFTYVTDFMVLEDIGEFILRDMAEVVMGKPFREVTKLEYDCAKGLMSFTRIFVNYTFQMPRTIPRLKIRGHVSWSKIPPILVLSQRDLINRFRSAYEKNKLMYKNCLNLSPDYQVDDSMKEWIIRGHVSINETT